MSNLLITGASGFVARSLLEKLLQIKKYNTEIIIRKNIPNLTKNFKYHLILVTSKIAKEIQHGHINSKKPIGFSNLISSK